MSLEQVAIALITKFPTPGKVKTRLTTQVTPEQAAAVHRCFVLHLMRRLRLMRAAEIFIYFDPPDALDAMADLCAEFSPITLEPQCSGDLGHRLAHIAGIVAGNHERMLILGADSPDVPAEHISRCASMTATSQVTLGLAQDGGFWCIGLRVGVDFRRLLHAGIDWSTARAAEQTLTNARELGLSTSNGQRWDDVDEPADLRRLLQRLAASDDAEDRRLLTALEAALQG